MILNLASKLIYALGIIFSTFLFLSCEKESGKDVPNQSQVSDLALKMQEILHKQKQREAEIERQIEKTAMELAQACLEAQGGKGRDDEQGRESNKKPQDSQKQQLKPPQPFSLDDASKKDKKTDKQEIKEKGNEKKVPKKDEDSELKQ
jgi:hypothetical protein